MSGAVPEKVAAYGCSILARENRALARVYAIGADQDSVQARYAAAREWDDLGRQFAQGAMKFVPAFVSHNQAYQRAIREIKK